MKLINGFKKKRVMALTKSLYIPVLADVNTKPLKIANTLAIRIVPERNRCLQFTNKRETKRFLRDTKTERRSKNAIKCSKRNQQKCFIVDD